jgi:hypothetical protein
MLTNICIYGSLMIYYHMRIQFLSIVTMARSYIKYGTVEQEQCSSPTSPSCCVESYYFMVAVET